MLFIHCTISERQRWMVLLSSQSGCYVPSLSSTGDGVNIGTVRQVIPKIRARLLPLVRLVSQRLKRDMKLRQTDMNRVFVTYIILVDSCVKLPDSLHQNLLWKLNWASYWSGSVKSSSWMHWIQSDDSWTRMTPALRTGGEKEMSTLLMCMIVCPNALHTET